MLPNEYDLQIAEDHLRERRRQVAAYRLAGASTPAGTLRPTVASWLRMLLSRLHFTRPARNRAEAAA
jgi:hypothetical protein